MYSPPSKNRDAWTRYFWLPKLSRHPASSWYFSLLPNTAHKESGVSEGECQCKFVFFILRFWSPGNILCKLCTPFALEHFLCLLSLLQRYHTHKVNLRTLHFAKLLSLQRKMLWLIFISEHWYVEIRCKNKHINIAQRLRLKTYQPSALKSKNSFPHSSSLKAEGSVAIAHSFL